MVKSGIALQVKELEEGYEALEKLYLSELERELGEPFSTRNLTRHYGNEIEDTHYIVVWGDTEYGAVFPFRKKTFIFPYVLSQSPAHEKAGEFFAKKGYSVERVQMGHCPELIEKARGE